MLHIIFDLSLVQTLQVDLLVLDLCLHPWVVLHILQMSSVLGIISLLDVVQLVKESLPPLLMLDHLVLLSHGKCSVSGLLDVLQIASLPRLSLQSLSVVVPVLSSLDVGRPLLLLVKPRVVIELLLIH